MSKKRERKAAARAAAAAAAAPPPPPPRRRSITETVKAAAASLPREPAPPVFTLPKPPPGIVPSGAPTMAQDEAIAGIYGWAGSDGYGSLGYDESLTFPGYPALASMAQRPEYRRACTIIAQEMTRKWVKLHGGQEEDAVRAQKLKEIDAEMKRLKIRDLFRRVTMLDGFFGRGQIYIDVGQAKTDLPLVIGPKTIKPGSLKAFRLLEPVWTYPTDYSSSDPLAPDFYKPRAWYVSGKKVHSSRLMTFVSREVPDVIKPAYSFGGLSLTQMGRPYVENWLRTRQSVSDLLHSFSTLILATDMSATLSGDPGGESLFDRVDLFNRTRDNRGTWAINKETEAVTNVTTPLGTLDALQAQAQEQLASVWAIPLVKLLGVTPSGLNASSDGEIRVFYDSIGAAQEDDYRDPLTRILQVIQLHLYGEIDPEIDFTFIPLWQMSETDKAAMRKANADTAAVYITDGVISPEEERQRLASDEDGVYQGLDMNDIPEPPAAPADPADPDPENGEPAPEGVPTDDE